jgi:hypothetical protein
VPLKSLLAPVCHSLKFFLPSTPFRRVSIQFSLLTHLNVGPTTSGLQNAPPKCLLPPPPPWCRATRVDRQAVPPGWRGCKHERSRGALAAASLCTGSPSHAPADARIELARSRGGWGWVPPRARRPSAGVEPVHPHTNPVGRTREEHAQNSPPHPQNYSPIVNLISIIHTGSFLDLL